MPTLDCSQEEFHAALQNPALEQEWKATVAEWTTGSQPEKDELVAWIGALRDDFLSVIAIVDDPEDLCYCAVVRYIEIKCQWILLNNQVNYTMVRTGSPPEMAMYRACFAAQLLAALEEHIHSHHIEAITDFLAEPTSVPEISTDSEGTVSLEKKKVNHPPQQDSP